MISDFSKEELTALAEAVDLYDRLVATLGRVEMYPKETEFHISSEVNPGYAGWIGHNENGCVVFQPATLEEGQ